MKNPLVCVCVVAAWLGGCGVAHDVYTVEPNPMVVRPQAADSVWGVDVSVEITDAIYVRVVNAGEVPVRVLWSDCSYIDVDGRSHPLAAKQGADTHSLGQLPASIAPGSRVEERLYPVVGQQSNSDDPLLPGRPSRSWRHPWLRWIWPFSQAQIGQPGVGKTIGVFLVLEREKMQRTLSSTYTIRAVHRGHE